MGKERMAYLDIARGIGMVCVILGHLILCFHLTQEEIPSAIPLSACAAASRLSSQTEI